MKYKVKLHNNYILYESKNDLMKDLIPYIKHKPIYYGMPRIERNVINFANKNKINLIHFSKCYTAQFIVEMAGGELL